MQTTIYDLRHEVLDPALAAKVFPFVNAYRPHDEVPNRTYFKEEGLDRVEDESLMDLIVEQYELSTQSVFSATVSARTNRP